MKKIRRKSFPKLPSVTVTSSVTIWIFQIMNSNFKLLILIYQLGLLMTCNQFQIDPTKFQTLQTEYFILCLNFLQNQSSRFDYWSNFIQISNLAHNTLIDFNFLSWRFLKIILIVKVIIAIDQKVRGHCRQLTMAGRYPIVLPKHFRCNQAIIFSFLLLW